MGIGMTCMKETQPSGNRVSISNNKSIYHEKQSKELCALHALNNLFQDEHAFTKKDLDDVCYKLSPESYINPHKSMLGLGNYDVNVIMGALQRKDYDTVWFDKRKNVENLVLENIEGFILNIPTDYKWGMVKLPLKRKHWVTLRQVGHFYYNLDSKLDVPEVIGDGCEFIRYLQEQVRCREKEMLLVVHVEVEKSGSWYRKLETTDCSDVCDKQLDTSEQQNNTCDSNEDLKCTEKDITAKQEESSTGNIDKIDFEEAYLVRPPDYEEKQTAGNGSILNLSSSRQKKYIISNDSRPSVLELTSHS